MRIQLIDVDEHALVVTVARSGATSVAHPRMCGSAAADVLRQIADQLDAAHPPYPCTPAAEVEARPDAPEPLGVGEYDVERGVWSDGTGHVWDLSVRWSAAAIDGEWEWSGVFDGSGTPVMRTVDGAGRRESLDILRALYGPIVAAVGGRS